MNTPDIESICQKSMIYYYDYLSSHRDQIPEDVLTHLAECAYCQQELHALQQIDLESDPDSTLTSEQTTHLELHFALTNQPIKCSTVKAFLPILSIPGHQVSIPTPVTTHINYCNRCREELKQLIDMNLSVLQYGYVSQIFSDQALQNNEAFSASQIKIIAEMLERPDSGIVTCFKLKDPLKSEAGETFEVEVSTVKTPQAGASPSTPVEIPLAASKKSRVSASNRRWYLRPLAAAAVLMIAALLLFRSSSLQATDLGQIYEALKNVTTVQMTKYDVDEATPIQETWISRPLGVKLIKSGDRFTEWNVKTKTQEIHDRQATQVQSITLTPETIEAVKKTMELPYGLLPFTHHSELPPGAIWEKVQAGQTGSDTEKTEVYNLFWTQKSVGGTPVDYQWQCCVDPVTKLPLKIKLWNKNSTALGYELITVTEIAYPTQAQMQGVLAETQL